MSIQITYLTPLIEVFNMLRSLEFYRDILGFEVHMDSGGGDNASWVWITKDGTHLMLNDQYEPGHVPAAPPAERVKWHKDTCIYFGCEDVDAAYDELRAKGVELGPPTIAPYGMKQLYLKDPDGYGICFQLPTDV
jgi:catechol 2,3-dioxygenase-like lactoylglutathione lyase family enzyme